MRGRLIAALTGLAFLAAACGPREAPAPPPAADRFEVALLTSGSIADEGWNAAAYDGLKRIQRDLGAAAFHREARTPAARHDAMRRVAASRFDLVFAQGEGFADAAAAAGESHGDTVFVVMPGDRMAPNLAPVTYRIEDGAWLLGMTAAFQSKTGRAGIVGGARSRAAATTIAAFRAGARSVRPGFVADEVYTGDAADTQAARRAALALIDGGADVLLQIAGEAGRGVLAACSERSVLCFAAPRNLNDRAPESVLASVVVDVPAAMVEIAALVRNGRFEPHAFSYGMEEGIVTIAWNEDLRRRIPPEAMKRIDAMEAAIREGRFDPGAVEP